MKKIIILILTLFMSLVSVNAITDYNNISMILGSNPGGGGFIIEPNADINNIQVTRNSGVTDGDRFQLKNATSGVVLYTNSSPSGDVFSVYNIQLKQGVQYIFTIDDSGSTYNRHYGSGSFPIVRENIDYINGWHDGLNTTQTNGFNILSITSSEVSPIVNMSTSLEDYYNSFILSAEVNTSTVGNLSYIIKENYFTNDPSCPLYPSLNCIPEFENKDEFVAWTNNDSSNVLLNFSDIVSLNDNSYGIKWVFNDGETNLTQNFTIDTTNPNITNNLAAEINSYVFDFNSTTCDDTNIDTCILTINTIDYDLLTLTNLTLTESGNVSYVITATDLANNILNESGVVFVNPYQYFYFQSPDTTPITNFTFGGSPFVDFAQFLTYDLGIGTSSLTFEKLGFENQTFAIVLSTTSNINQTYTISDASIIINMKRKDDGTTITGQNFSADFIATVGATATTTTGVIEVSNVFFLNEQYTVTITSEDYLTEQLTFTFSNEEVQEIDAYFIEKNSTEVGAVFVKVVDLGSKPVKNAKVFAQQWDSTTSSFITVTQGLTGEDGLTSMNIILNDKTYKFTASQNGATGESVNDIITDSENGKTLTIPLDSSIAVTNYFLQNLDYTISESFNNATNISTITFDWENLDGLNQEICINHYRTIANSERLVTGSCTSGVSGQLIQAYFINSSNIVTLKGEVKYENSFITLKSFKYNPETSPSELLLDLSIAPFVIPILFLLSIAIGLYIENLYIGSFLLMISGGISLYLVPTLINGGITAFFFFIGWMMISSGVKPR